MFLLCTCFEFIKFQEGDVIFKLFCSEYRMNLLRICNEIC